MTKAILSDLRELSQIIGVSSREERVVKAIKEKITPLVDELIVDKMGNLIATVTGSSKEPPTLMLDAHTDEIGLMISHISSEGFLYFAKIGGFVDFIFPAQRVVFVPETSDKPLVHGVIGIKPPHMLSKEEMSQAPKVSELAIDIGASSAEGVEERGLVVGSTGTLAGDFVELSNGRVIGKAFDDRTGCVVLIETIRRLAKKKPKGTIVFNFASAEEVGGRGATTAAFAIEPDMALAIENTTAGDMPRVNEKDCPCKLGAGPAISVADRSLICNNEIVEKLKALANERAIPWQFKKPLLGGTDAGRIAISREGVPSGVVSVPCRYIHSPISLLEIKDIERTCDLVEAFSRHFQELL
jgi:endoglucanase